MTTPYSDLSEAAFWRTAVAEKNPLQIRGLWSPKIRFKRRDKIVTAGSCFAQHIGNALSDRGYNWFDAEPAPKLMPQKIRRDFGYGVFSFRTGNIYTARMLLQWLELAYGLRDPIDMVWEEDGRFYDPLRPAIEPGGFESREEVLASRNATLSAIRKAVEETDVFVFTLGLTESWQNIEHGFEYAICPGTVAGAFNEETDVFLNHNMESILQDMLSVLKLLREKNSALNVLLTVSPVPLTATASGKHVLTATTYSKSVLRAVAGQLSDGQANVDYFPSYEIITSPPYRAMFYGANMRSVVLEGVAVVMDNFFHDQEAAFGVERDDSASAAKPKAKSKPKGHRAVQCEEEILGAFAR